MPPPKYWITKIDVEMQKAVRLQPDRKWQEEEAAQATFRLYEDSWEMKKLDTLTERLKVGGFCWGRTGDEEAGHPDREAECRWEMKKLDALTERLKVGQLGDERHNWEIP